MGRSHASLWVPYPHGIAGSDFQADGYDFCDTEFS